MTPSANFPTFMSFCNYVLLSFYIMKRFIRNGSGGSTTTLALRDVKLSNSLMFYFFAAILDVEANFLVITAYNYTSITSIMLLDCFTIPSSMVLSMYFLRAKYQVRHIGGILICLSGLGCIVASDIRRDGEMSNAIVGDILCLFGSFLYACSNVLQEKVVKSQDREEYVGMLGVCGSCIALVQWLATDLAPMQQAKWDIETILYLAGFVCCLYCMYINTSLFLQGTFTLRFVYYPIFNTYHSLLHVSR